MTQVMVIPQIRGKVKDNEESFSRPLPFYRTNDRIRLDDLQVPLGWFEVFKLNTSYQSI